MKRGGGFGGVCTAVHLEKFMTAQERANFRFFMPMRNMRALAPSFIH